LKRLSTVMIVVAILALNLAAIRTFEYGLEDRLVFDAFPTVNVLILAASLYRRAFTPGLVSAGSLTLIGCQHWAHEHPWRWLQYVTPTFQFLDRNLLGLPPYPPIRRPVRTRNHRIRHSPYSSWAGGWIPFKQRMGVDPSHEGGHKALVLCQFLI
jgi:hypothetical protein